MSISRWTGPNLGWPGTTAESDVAVSLTSGAGAGVKGSYVELVAATAKKVKAIVFHPYGTVGTGFHKFDIATGGAGAESIKIPDLEIHATELGASSQAASWITLPFEVPSNTRIAARFSENTGSQTVTLMTTYIEE